MPYIVGAYAASSADPASGATEQALIDRLHDEPLVGGLELAFTGSSSTPPAVASTWNLVVTAIPGTVARTLAQPGFGLASPDEGCRRAALDFTAALRDHVESLDAATGRAAVVAVEIHSAPPRFGDAGAFTESLAEIASWNWGSATLTVEHCDAYRPTATPQKGYLSLAAELAAVEAVRRGKPSARVGMTVNWARSAIEARDVREPLRHIEAAVRANALTGLMFSGCAATDGAFGPAWLDAHLPPLSGEEKYADADSLLTGDRIRESLRAAAGQPRFIGLKMAVRPTTADVGERAAQVGRALRIIEASRQAEAPMISAP